MKKKASYVPSNNKSTNKKADAVLGDIRRKQAVEDLVRSNKKMGLVVPKSLDVSTSETVTTTTDRSSNTRARSKKS